ncbi:hypothetical protein CQW23_23529 [Capsicum baccatum]|uniref:Uncharacterized protein n=1 Tax=Capsicum baccatum TaxID=33114 RepID=A0A2G2VS68_CAPBA|nr:hypothetical protein CQW23_23529 [Capsicum baccatum]
MGEVQEEAYAVPKSSYDQCPLDGDIIQARGESDFEEEANYLNNQGGFRGNAQGNQGRNYYDKSGTKDRNQDMMAKLLKGVEATSTGVTKLSATINQRKAGTLPSDTVHNPRNDGSCRVITTRSGKVLDNPSKDKQVVDDIEEIVIDADCDDFVEAENQKKRV